MAEEDLVLDTKEEMDADDQFAMWLDLNSNVRENIETSVMVHSYLDRIDLGLCDARTAEDIKSTQSKCLDLIIDGIAKLEN